MKTPFESTINVILYAGAEHIGTGVVEDKTLGDIEIARNAFLESGKATRAIISDSMNPVCSVYGCVYDTDLNVSGLLHTGFIPRVELVKEGIIDS